ncbi:M20 family metallopeptidase [Georgenia sp. AZ-5]|uniref:M20 family metallopeptidase n=1 Tax=Georgenia sp. AZ-5 TaxID=3367526 RepID=UPI003754B2B5
MSTRTTVGPATSVAETLADLEPLLADVQDQLVALARDIHAHPQVRFQEEHAAAALVAALRADGVSTETGFAGLPTAFVGRWSSPAAGPGAPTLAIFCEYDALEGIGHGCGHNVIAAAGLGAALVTKAWLKRHPGVPAHLLVVGSPGEEGGGGKVPMVEAGLLDGVDAAMMVHPSSVDLVAMPTLGRVALDIDFTGRPSHASASPEQGVNALDAATLAWSAIGMLRQQMPPEVRVHGIVTDGGQAPNIIPEHAALRVFVRAPDAGRLHALVPRVEDCARGAALATGCNVTIEQRTPPYHPLLTNSVMGQIVTAAMELVGRQVGAGSSGMGVGSTDMGNVSQLVPSVHPTLKLEEGLDLHTREFATAAAGPRMASAVLDGARVLAATALTLFTDPAALSRVKKEFAASNALRRAR